MAHDPYASGITIDLGDGDIIVERGSLTPSVDGFRFIHTVLEGETIQSIAFKYYKDSGYWVYIADINSIYDPFEELEPGMELFIP